jgi:copper chaperone CopZ
MKKICYLLILLLSVSSIASAQVVKVELQAAGLTCSMCSRATDRQLRTLDFVDSIAIDLSRTTFVLYFKKDKTVDFDQIRKKVEDAGFSVATLQVTYKFDNLKVDNGTQFSYNGSQFQFMGISPKILNGDIAFRIMDKGFLSAKEYKKYASQVGSGTGHLYHITL